MDNVKYPSPVLKSKDGGEERYIDIIQSVDFSVLTSMSRGCFEISIRKDEKGATVTSRRGYGETLTGHITDRKWYDLLDKLLNQYCIFDWKKNWNEKGVYVMDGTSWCLKLGLTGGRRRTWRGGYTFPPHWDDAVKTFEKYERKIPKIIYPEG